MQSPTVVPARPSLRELQINSISRMLNLNSDSDQTNVSIATEPVWKVLIYDALGQEVISPLLKVNDLRERGVTVHLYVFDIVY
jgi:hypothetical protein